MNPVEVTALRCACCGQLYPNNKGGREAAEACCRCPRCKERVAGYIGGHVRTPCVPCREEVAFEEIQRNVDRARDVLQAAEAALASATERRRQRDAAIASFQRPRKARGRSRDTR